jgi:PD-(D/E)XK endonuclease
VRCITSRHTPRGYLRSTDSADEIDAIAAYSPDTGACYLIPIAEVDGHSTVSLRLAPTANNQALNVRWARDYDLATSLRRSWGVACPMPEDTRNAAR